MPVGVGSVMPSVSELLDPGAGAAIVFAFLTLERSLAFTVAELFLVGKKMNIAHWARG